LNTFHAVLAEAGPSLEQAARWIATFRDSVVVVKLGGEVLAAPAATRRVAQQIGILAQCGIRVVVVHGAGPQIDDACRAAGLTITKIHGRRVTDAATLDVVVQVAQNVNAELVAAIGSIGLPVRGMGAWETFPISAHRRPPVPQADGDPVDYGLVGDVDGIHPGLATDPGIAVLPSLGHDPHHGFLNINADTLARAVATGLGARKLVFLTSVPGVLPSSDAPGPVSTMSVADARRLLAGEAVTGGMKAKLEECVRAVEAGVERVHIISGKEPFTLIREVFTDEGCGTLVKP
jgi:acetylglutamate kinase